MAPRESQKRASLKWDKENMTVLSCKIRKDQAAEFKAYCENQGSTSNTVLKDFVLECIGEQEPGAPQAAPGGEGISLHPQALKTAQEAAQNTGKTVEQFIERAVQTQAQGDKSSLGLGINPATGGKLEKEA